MSEKKPKKKILLRVIIIICLICFLVSGGILGYYWYEYWSMDNIAQQAVELTEQTPTPEQIEALPEGAQDEAGAAYAANPDYIATITIPDTVIHYAVVKSKDNKDYLTTNFYGNYSRLGTIFTDYRCVIGPNEVSNNIVIYGHNANNGSFFHHSLDYKNTSFANTHSIVHFDTIYGDGTYVVVGAFLYDPTTIPEDSFPYYGYIDFYNEDRFIEFQNQINQRSYFHTSLDWNSSDQYITLSTCAYDVKDARFVVVARRLREGETEDSVKGTYTANGNIRMPNDWYLDRRVDNPFI